MKQGTWQYERLADTYPKVYGIEVKTLKVSGLSSMKSLSVSTCSKWTVFWSMTVPEPWSSSGYLSHGKEQQGNLAD